MRPCHVWSSNLLYILVKRMVMDELTEDEQQIAARTSYAYWAWEQLHNDDDYDKDRSKCIRMAMREARRHYVGEHGDYETALKRFKTTLKWRKERQVDLIRLCFAGSSANFSSTTNSSSMQTVAVELSEANAKVCFDFEQLIEADFRAQTMAVRGHDRENRPIIVKLCRRQPWNAVSEESFALAQLFVAERAVAASEFLSKGTAEKLSAIFDFGEYNSANSPPVMYLVNTIKMLQANYPERIGKALILDAPFWMRAVHQIIFPFLAKKTRDCISLLGGEASVSLSNLLPGSTSLADLREETVQTVVKPEQAMPFMLKNAKLTTQIDVDQQLRRVPFHELYDFIV